MRAILGREVAAGRWGRRGVSEVSEFAQASSRFRKEGFFSLWMSRSLIHLEISSGQIFLTGQNRTKPKRSRLSKLTIFRPRPSLLHLQPHRPSTSSYAPSPLPCSSLYSSLPFEVRDGFHFDLNRLSLSPVSRIPLPLPSLPLSSTACSMDPSQMLPPPISHRSLDLQSLLDLDLLTRSGPPAARLSWAKQVLKHVRRLAPSSPNNNNNNLPLDPTVLTPLSTALTFILSLAYPPTPPSASATSKDLVYAEALFLSADLSATGEFPIWGWRSGFWSVVKGSWRRTRGWRLVLLRRLRRGGWELDHSP